MKVSKAAKAGIRSPNAGHCLRPSQWLGHLKSQVCTKAPTVQPIARKYKKAYFSTKERREVVIESNDIGPYSEALWLDYQRPSMNEIMLRSNCVNTSLTMERVPQSRFNIKLSPNSEFVLSVPLVMHFNLQPPLPLSPPHHILLFFSHHLCFSHSLVCLLSCFWQT